MAEPVSLVQFPFTAGINENLRDELVEPGQGWATLENGRQDHVGGYSTRNGFAAFSTVRVDGTSATVGYKLFADRTAICRITDTLSAESYSSTLGRWQSHGRVPNAAARLIPLPSMGASTTLEDVEACNGYIAAAWLVLSGGSGYAYAAIVDETTGTIIRAPELVGSGTSTGYPLLATYGAYFILVRYDAANTLSAWYLDTTSAATITTGWVAFSTPLVADASAMVAYAVQGLGTRFAVFYANNAGGTDQATAIECTIAGVTRTQTINTSSTLPDEVAIAGSASDTLWLAWNEGGDVKVRGQSPTTITTTLASALTVFSLSVGVTQVSVAASATAGKCRVWANETPVASKLNAKMRGVQTSGGAAAGDGSAVTVPNAQMFRKPFAYSGRYYSLFFGGDSTNTQAVGIVCDWTDDATTLRPVANPGQDLAALGSYGKGKIMQGATTGRYLLGMGITRSGAASGSFLVEIDFLSPRRWLSTSCGDSTYLSGGLAAYFDGVRVAEAGFLMRPKQVTAAKAAGALTGTFYYAAVYEEVDADGNWHQSGISTPSAAVVCAGETPTLSTTPLSITSRAGATANARSTRVAWYRTTGIAGTGAYCRLGTSINDTSSTGVTYVDTDTTYAMTGAKLYSQPGVLGTAQDHRSPPPFQCIVSYNGMLVGASGSDVWYSGQSVSGEGLWFSPIFQVPVPGDGDITALWVQDGTLFAAKRRGIYAINGEAPSDNGASGGLGTPRRLAVDTGCIEARSPCTTAIGTFFQSERGIELLSRAQTVEWIGGDVQDTVAAYPICTSITVEPVSNTVLVELAASESGALVGGDGRTLVYDLALRVWVSADRRTSTGGTADRPSQSACMAYTGSAYRYCWIDYSGSVQYETPASYLHASGAIIAKRAISPNVKAAGLQGSQHVNKALVLAKYHTPHDLNVSFAYDYATTYKTARLYTAAQLLTLTTAISMMQLEHGLHNDARCEAVRVKLEDVTPSSGTLGTGQGATWIALAFEVTPQPGAYKLPDAAR